MRQALLVVMLLVWWSGEALAQHERGDHRTNARQTTSEANLVLLNTALTGAFTLGRGVIEGQVENWTDAARMFVVGAAGGYGFYHAKRIAGRGRPAAGLALGYGWTSMVENTAQGHHPLSHVRFGIGGLDARIKTGFASSEEGPVLSMEINALWIASFVALLPRSQSVFLKGGMLGHLLPTRDGQPYGRTIGRFIALEKGSERKISYVASHESVHVIQNLQASAVTPYYRLSRFLNGTTLRLGEPVAWDLQLDWLYGTLALADLQRPYSDRWSEIEAYTFRPYF